MSQLINEKKHYEFGPSNIIYLMRLPLILIITITAIMPIVYTFVCSLTYWSYETEGYLLGWNNFVYILRDVYWWKAVRNSVVITIISVPCQLVIGTTLAMLLYHTKRNVLLRFAMLLPWLTPIAISARIWQWILNDTYGIVNETMITCGVISNPIPWLTSPKLSIFVVAFVEIWRATPLTGLIILARLNMMPREIMESARIDSDSSTIIFKKVVLPFLMPVISVLVVLRGIESLKIFDLSYILCNGSRRTATMSVYIKQHLINYSNIGVGSAASVVIIGFMLISLILYVIYAKFYIKKTHT